MRTVRLAGLLVLAGAALRIVALFVPYGGGVTLADDDAALVEGLVLGGVLAAAGGLTLLRPDAEFAAGLCVGTGWFVAALQFFTVLRTIDLDLDTDVGFLLATLGAALALAGAVTLTTGVVPTRRTHAVTFGVLSAGLSAAAFAFAPLGPDTELLVDALDAATLRTVVVMVVSAALPLAATKLGELGAGIAAGCAAVFAALVAALLVGADGRELALGLYLRVAAGVALLALAVQLVNVEEEAPSAGVPRTLDSDVAP